MSGIMGLLTGMLGGGHSAVGEHEKGGPRGRAEPLDEMRAKIAAADADPRASLSDDEVAAYFARGGVRAGGLGTPPGDAG